MKLRESAAFKLFDKYQIAHPKIGVKAGKVVVKADLPMGGKKKAGLVRICDTEEILQASSRIQERMQEIGISDGGNIIFEEFIPHSKEFFVAIRPTREGLIIYTSDKGGIDVEENWQTVLKKTKPTTEFEKNLVEFFEAEDATYLEINPYTENNVALGVVLELDEAAKYRHPDWAESTDVDKQTDREKRVAEIDSQIKGSVKLVEVSRDTRYEKRDTKLTAVMGGGAGSVLFLCDAVLNSGLQLANYAEFSGSPPNWALTELTKEVCKIPGIKNLVIGSGIANFTPVKNNIEAIIEGLRQSPQAKNLHIVVRRCGPGEEEGIRLMREFAQVSRLNILVFGRETGMTEIVSKLLIIKHQIPNNDQ